MSKLIIFIIPLVLVTLITAILPMNTTANGIFTLCFSNFDTKWNTPIRGLQRYPTPNNTDWVDPPGVEPGSIWNVVPGDTQGNYVMTAKSDDSMHRGTAIFAGDTSWSSYVLEARVKANTNYWGLIFNADSSGQQFYDVYFSPGSTELFKHTDGIWGRDFLGHGNNTMGYDTWYKVKVNVSTRTGGIDIMVWYAPDGQNYPTVPQFQCADDPNNPYFDHLPIYSSGRIGLMFYDDNPPVGNEAFFDDIKVSTVTGSILFSDSFDDYLAKWHKINSSIPLTWQFKDINGNAVDSANSNPVITWTFNSATQASGILLDDNAPGANGLYYNPSTKTWQFNWKTKNLSEGVYNLNIRSNQPACSGPIPIGLR
jgi:hypothetical protein